MIPETGDGLSVPQTAQSTNSPTLANNQSTRLQSPQPNTNLNSPINSAERGYVQQVSAGGGFTNSVKKLKKKSPNHYMKEVRTSPANQSPVSSGHYGGQILLPQNPQVLYQQQIGQHLTLPGNHQHIISGNVKRQGKGRK